MLEPPREEGSEEEGRRSERRRRVQGQRIKEERKRKRKKEKRKRRGERERERGRERGERKELGEGGERKRASEQARGHSVIQPGKAKPVKMFADVSWEKASFYRSPDGSNVIDRPAGLMNGRSSDGAVARRTVKPIVGLF